MLAANGKPVIAIMIESRLLARRGNQYVLLKKWDLDNGRNVQRSARRDAKSAGRPAPFGLPTGSGNGSASRGVTAYAARGSN